MKNAVKAVRSLENVLPKTIGKKSSVKRYLARMIDSP